MERVIFDQLAPAQAAFPNGPHLGPTGAQLGPIWNAAWVGYVFIMLIAIYRANNIIFLLSTYISFNYVYQWPVLLHTYRELRG